MPWILREVYIYNYSEVILNNIIKINSIFVIEGFFFPNSFE